LGAGRVFCFLAEALLATLLDVLRLLEGVDAVTMGVL
jgi:hypothetical protein